MFSIDKYSKPLIKGPKAVYRAIVMHAYYKRKLFASAVTAALVLSSLLLISGVQAGAADDLEVSDLYEPPGTPPPRVNVAYDIVVGWKNSGDTNSYTW